MYKLFLLSFVFMSGMLAQSTLTLTGPVSVRPGQTATLDLTLGGTAAPAGLQWSMTPPSSFTATVTGGTALGSTKTLYCNSPICLAVGLNVATIPAGVVAKYAVPVGVSTPKGIYSFPITEPMAVDADGNALTVALGTSYQLRILARSDINGDGLTNITDFNLMIDQAIGRSPCTADQTGDGKCNLLDVFVVLRDALQ